MAVPVFHEPDIGRCDDCGSEDGERRCVPLIITVAGEREQVDAWLCPACLRRREESL